MIRAGTGISELRDGERAAREAATRALAAAGIERADALFVFATSEHARRYPAILRALEAYADPAAIAGCSASGVLTQEREIESGPAVVVLAAAGEGLSVEAGLLPEGSEPRELGQAVGLLAGRTEDPFILIFPSLETFDPDAFFDGVAAAGKFLPVVGGAPSARDGRIFQFAGGKVAEGRTATAVVRAGARVEIAVAQGCRPMGRPAVITKVGGPNVIAGLASKPAVAVLAAALEDAGIDDVDAAQRGIFAGIAIDPSKHPLERGDFLVRPIVGIDSDTGSIAVGERVSVGQTVVFQLRDGETAREDLEETLSDLARRLEKRAPRFGLYFDCLGRGSGLYGKPDHDVARIRAHFPNLPVAGFFGNGEIAPVGGRNHLHTYTGVLAVFCDP